MTETVRLGVKASDSRYEVPCKILCFFNNEQIFENKILSRIFGCKIC